MENENQVNKAGCLLYVALCRAQAMFLVPKKTKTNPHFKMKYADLADVIEATKEGLVKNDLCVSQGVVGTNLKTILMHKSGESIETLTPLLLDKQTMQGLGSALTYARRYALSALLNVASDEDDDGNAASEKRENNQNIPAKNVNAPVTEPQLKRLFAIMKTCEWTQEQMKLYMEAAFKISSTKDLDREKYDHLILEMQNGNYASAMKGMME